MNGNELLDALNQNKESFKRIESITVGKETGIEKACPFCGCDDIGVVRYKHDVGSRYSVFCCGCTASIDPGWAQEPVYVVEMWNKRVYRGQ